MRRLLIILVALFLLIGGGGGAAYFFFLRPVAETPEEMAKREAKEAEAKRKARLEQPPIFIEPTAVPGPLVQNGKVRAYLFIGIRVDCADNDTLNKLTAVQYELSEKILADVNNHPIPLVPNTANADLVAVKSRLRQLIETEAGKDKVNDVLIAFTYLQSF